MMDSRLKQRLIGATVLIVLAIIFVPMLFEDEAGSLSDNAIPPKPDFEFNSKVTPLDEPIPAPPAPAPAPASVPPPISEAPPEPETFTPPAEAPTAPAQEPAASAALEPPPEVPVPAPAEAPVDESSPPPAEIPAAAQPPQSSHAAAGTTPPEATPQDPALAQAWVVQMGSFSNEQNALKLRDQLRAKGYTAFVEMVDGAAGKGKVARVRVGPEEDRARAEMIRDKLQKEFKIKGIIDRYAS